MDVQYVWRFLRAQKIDLSGRNLATHGVGCRLPLASANRRTASRVDAIGYKGLVLWAETPANNANRDAFCTSGGLSLHPSGR